MLRAEQSRLVAEKAYKSRTDDITDMAFNQIAAKIHKAADEGKFELKFIIEGSTLNEDTMLLIRDKISERLCNFGYGVIGTITSHLHFQINW
jgi:precorrin-2 methylase